MTPTTGRAPARLPRLGAYAIALAAGLCIAAGASYTVARAATDPATSVKARFAKHMARMTHASLTWTARVSAAAPARSAATDVAPEDADGLSFSDEYERAELVEEMLAECRGIAYNAYELARTSGESLWLPAPIQLFVVRVRHPYCAELVRTYAPKQSV